MTHGSTTKTQHVLQCSFVPHLLPPMVFLTCPQCGCTCKNLSGLRQHENSAHGGHAGLSIPVTDLRRSYHPNLNGMYKAFSIPLFSPLLAACRCDRNGVFVPPNTPPESSTPKVEDDWSPFTSRAGFELADFLFTDMELSQKKIH